MFRGNIKEDESVTISREEIVSFGYQYYFVLNIITGELKNYCGMSIKTGWLPITGIPIAIYQGHINTISVKYCDHTDLFNIVFNSGIIIRRIVVDDKDYLGVHHESIGSSYSYRLDDDLLIYDRIQKDFFKKCKIFLYISNPEFVFDAEYEPDDIAHYIDFDDEYHGRNQNYTRIREYFIINDVNLCIANLYGEVFVIDEYFDEKIYQFIIGLDITYIEIHYDVCRIYTPDTSYVIYKGHYTEVKDNSLSLFPTYFQMKSSRNV